MKTQVTMLVLGAQYYDIENEKTKQMQRFTSVFTAQAVEADKSDRIGMVPGKVRCAASAVVQQLQAFKLPAEITFDAELTVNAKGESRLVLQSIVPGVKKAA